MTPSEFHSSQSSPPLPSGASPTWSVEPAWRRCSFTDCPLCGYEWRGVLEDLASQRRSIALDAMGLGYTEVASGQGVSFAEKRE